jgi:hypothetical protein
MVFLALGPVLFQEFEIPEKLPFGGDQMLVVRKLIGGDRVVDAMGRDDGDKEWSGRFRGASAEARARQLDSLRIAGQSLLLTWSSLRYLVVIKSFKAEFQQPYEIPYSITCLVLQDLSSPILQAAPSVDASITSDVNAATLISQAIGVVQITTAVSGAVAAVSAAGSFQGASVATISATQTSLSAALAATGAQQDAQNNIVAAGGNVAGMIAGGNPAALSSVLLNQTAAFTQLGQLYQLSNLLGRAKVNVANAGA